MTGTEDLVGRPVVIPDPAPTPAEMTAMLADDLREQFRTYRHWAWGDAAEHVSPAPAADIRLYGAGRFVPTELTADGLRTNWQKAVRWAAGEIRCDIEAEQLTVGTHKSGGVYLARVWAGATEGAGDGPPLLLFNWCVEAAKTDGGIGE